MNKSVILGQRILGGKLMISTLSRKAKVVMLYDYYLAGLNHLTLLRLVNKYNWFDKQLTSEELYAIINEFDLKRTVNSREGGTDTTLRDIQDMTSKSVDPMHIGDSGLDTLESCMDAYNEYEGKFGYGRNI